MKTSWFIEGGGRLIKRIRWCNQSLIYFFYTRELMITNSIFCHSAAAPFLPPRRLLLLDFGPCSPGTTFTAFTLSWASVESS